MKFVDLEDVLYHIRVNHYGLCEDDAGHLDVAFVGRWGNGDINIVVIDHAHYGTSRSFSYKETLAELRELQKAYSKE